MDRQFRRYSRNSHILLIRALAVTLTLKIVNQVLCTTLRLMITHHHTKFGKKWLSGAGDIVQTNSDTQTNGQTDKMIPVFIGGGGYNNSEAIWGCAVQSMTLNKHGVYFA